nr:MAG TPA: hypothetical protein [Caudoviricetes sp.]
MRFDAIEAIKAEHEQLLKVERELSDLAEKREKLENERERFAYRYRADSVDRVLDFIRSEYRQGRLCNLETLLCHCQNKLNGNIDGTELDLDERLRGVSFKRAGESDEQ